MSIRNIIITCLAGALAGCLGNGGLVDKDFTNQVTVSSFFPRTGPVSGGTVVTIAGQNFNDQIRVFFGDVEATSVHVENNSILTAVAPPGGYGPTALTLMADDVAVHLAQPFRYAASAIRLGFEQDLGTSGVDAAFGAGDFNGDGRFDYVIASQGSLRLYLNTTAGFVYHSQQPLPLALDFSSFTCIFNNAPKYSLAVFDANRDGLDDVAVSVFNDRALHMFESTAEGFSSAVISQHPELFDECNNRVLQPLHADAGEAMDLAVVNHDADRSASSKPERLGTVGVLYNVGTAEESSAKMAVNSYCTRFHSFSVNQNIAPNAIQLLCSIDGENISQTLSAIEIAAGNVTAAIIADGIPTSMRYHYADFANDGEPELVYVSRSTGASPTVPTYEGGIATRVGNSLANEQSFDLLCHADPLVLTARLMPGQPSQAIFLCPEALAIHGLYDQPGDSVGNDISMNSELFHTLRGPDFANTTADGTPLMPSAYVADVDTDGLDELLLQRMNGRNVLLYANQISPAQASPAVALEPTKMIQRFESVKTPTTWVETHGIYDAGHPGGGITDLDGNGIVDLVMRSFGHGGESEAVFGEWNALESAFDFRTLVLTPRPGKGSTRFLPLLVDDFNSDGVKDFVAPYQELGAIGAQTYANVALSAGGAYVETQHVLISDSAFMDIQRVPSTDPATISFAGYVRKSATGNLWDQTFQEHIDVVVVSGTFANGFQQQGLVASDLSISGGVAAFVDLDEDGDVDVLSWYGSLCWGDELAMCNTVGATPLFNQPLSPGSLHVSYAGEEQAFKLFARSADELTATWISLTGRAASATQFVLDPAWSFYDGIEQSQACDIDGDGLGEMMFMLQETDGGLEFLVLAGDAEGGQTHINLVPMHQLSGLQGFACADIAGDGIDDVFALGRTGPVYWIPNHSK